MRFCVNSYKTVIIFCVSERMWKDCYGIICIVRDNVYRTAFMMQIFHVREGAGLQDLIADKEEE